MNDTISNDEIIEAAVSIDERLMDMVDQGFSVDAINGIVLARLIMLNRETQNENGFYDFVSTLKQETELSHRTLQ